MSVCSTRSFDSRQHGRMSYGSHLNAPDSQLRREVTHELDINALPHNYTEDTDEYYLNTKSNVRRERDRYSEPRRSFSDEGHGSPLIFQSTLSSLSKEDNSSDGMDDINLGNTNSIFRPRQGVSSSDRKGKRSRRDEHLPNLLSHSNLEQNGNDGVHKYYANQPALHNQVTNTMNASFEHSTNSNHPVEVVFDPSRKRRKVDYNQTLKKLPADVDYFKVFQLFGQALDDFTYLLPGVKPFLTYQSIDSQETSASRYLTTKEISIVKRRLQSAVFAFGGNMTKPKLKTLPYHPFESDRARSYSKNLDQRYYEHDLRLSWDVEENISIDLFSDLNVEEKSGRSPSNETSRFKKAPSLDNEDVCKKVVSKDQPILIDAEGESTKEKELKPKYRCKLCGQPKQNHSCPYRQSLQRSIGTMSYPALNSFECTEPGEFAPSLSEMNNFFHNNIDESQESNNSTVDNQSKGSKKKNLFGNAIHLVASDQLTSEGVHMSADEKRFLKALKNKRRKISIQSSFVKRQSEEYAKDTLMRTSVDLKPEQCKEISVKKPSGSFVYPTLPLTYLQRYSMSDSLFNLCKERFGLVEECSCILDEAKRSDAWDLAVAELTTQVLLILYCPIEDRTLEGLRKYLMLMGISC